MENESMTLPNKVLYNAIGVGCDVFIETGTYDGRTVQQALDCGFSHVFSIEVSSTYYAQSQERFKGDGRVSLFLGDSALVLRSVIDTVRERNLGRAMFWLDAHIQEGWQGNVPAPLLQELEVIRMYNTGRNDIIAIDDRRLMGVDVPGWRDVTVTKVNAALLSINPDYLIHLVDSKAAEKDIIIARWK